VADRRPGLRRIVVVKIGSSTLVDEAGRPQRPVFARVAGECAELVSAGTPVVVVSSGAVALGIGELGKSIRPRGLATCRPPPRSGRRCSSCTGSGRSVGSTSAPARCS